MLKFCNSKVNGSVIRPMVVGHSNTTMGTSTKENGPKICVTDTGCLPMPMAHSMKASGELVGDVGKVYQDSCAVLSSTGVVVWQVSSLLSREMSSSVRGRTGSSTPPRALCLAQTRLGRIRTSKESTYESSRLALHAISIDSSQGTVKVPKFKDQRLQIMPKFYWFRSSMNVH